jgi:hypothetical protein
MHECIYAPDSGVTLSSVDLFHLSLSSDNHDIVGNSLAAGANGVAAMA